MSLLITRVDKSYLLGSLMNSRPSEPGQVKLRDSTLYPIHANSTFGLGRAIKFAGKR